MDHSGYNLEINTSHVNAQQGEERCHPAGVFPGPERTSQGGAHQHPQWPCDSHTGTSVFAAAPAPSEADSSAD